MIDAKKIKSKAEERRKIPSESFLDMVDSVEAMKRAGVKKASGRDV